LQLILKKHDVIVSAFTDATKALSHFESNIEEYRVVVSDIKMRGMNGFEFTSQVKRLSPGIKVLLMTAFDINKEDLENGMKGVEIDGFIRKPFALENFAHMIKRHLGDSDMPDREPSLVF
jgi:DNA-binding NtrC family response regulator